MKYLIRVFKQYPNQYWSEKDLSEEAFGLSHGVNISEMLNLLVRQGKVYRSASNGYKWL